MDHPPIEEVTEGNALESATGSVDVRGYLAVRAWVGLQGLDALLKNEDVQVVDTTPQDVRDQLSKDRRWQNRLIDSVAIEMPVWAYQW